MFNDTSDDTYFFKNFLVNLKKELERYKKIIQVLQTEFGFHFNGR